MRLLRRVAGVASVMILTATTSAGCGEEQGAPVEAVPELADTLEGIDEALAAGRPVQARRLVEQLIDATIDARDDGDLDREAADGVLVAAARLLAKLPDAPPAEPAEVEPEPVPEGEGDDESDKKPAKGRKKPKDEEDDKHDKDDGDDEDGDGGDD